jgi:hypothetical protein
VEITYVYVVAFVYRCLLIEPVPVATTHAAHNFLPVLLPKLQSKSAIVPDSKLKGVPKPAGAHPRRGGGAQGRVIVGYLAEILGKVDIPAGIEGTILVVCTTLGALIYPANPRA